jgi:hypothetical protein
MRLLAATLPVPIAEVTSVVNDHTGGCASVDEHGMATIMAALSIPVGSGRLASSGARGAVLPTYSFATRAARCFRWALLKSAGAAGTAVLLGGVGMLVGIAGGSIASVPTRTWSRLSDWGVNDFSEDETALVGVKLFVVACACLYHGIQRRDLMVRGLKLGVVSGTVAGWFSALWLVNPDNHGWRSAFCAGLRGDAFFDPSSRSIRRQDVTYKDVFKALTPA